MTTVDRRWPVKPHDIVMMGMRRNPPVSRIDVTTSSLLELFGRDENDELVCDPADVGNVIGWYARRMPDWVIARRVDEAGGDTVVFARMDEPKKDFPAGVRDE